MSENKRTILFALGAGAAVIAAALIYHFVSTSSSESETDESTQLSFDEIQEMLKQQNLDQAIKLPNGQIDPQYFLKLLQFVGVTTRESTADKKKILTTERRKHYQNKDWTEYEESVKKAIQLEDQAAQDLLNIILQCVNLSEQEFGMTHQKLAQNPQMAEFVMAAQQGKLQQPDVKKQPTLTKQQTLTHLDVTSKVQEEQMKQMKDFQMDDGGDQMTMMVKMMVEQQKAQDRIFLETGIENEDFEAALLHFCAKDPEVSQAMQRYMMKMRGAMGGM